MKKVLIVGGGKSESMAAKIAQAHVEIHDTETEVVSQTFDVASQPPLLKVPKPPLTRAERRKQSRKTKNNKQPKGKT